MSFRQARRGRLNSDNTMDSSSHHRVVFSERHSKTISVSVSSTARFNCLRANVVFAPSLSVHRHAYSWMSIARGSPPNGTRKAYSSRTNWADRTARVMLRPAAKAAGLDRVTWHQLRHIHASVLHDIGVPAKIAQHQLGHASVETTLNFYTHVIPDTHRRAIESLEEALFPVVPKCSQIGDSGKETKAVIH